MSLGRMGGVYAALHAGHTVGDYCAAAHLDQAWHVGRCAITAAVIARGKN